MGREVGMPAQLTFEWAVDTNYTRYYGHYAERLSLNMEKAHEMDCEHLGKSTKRI